MTRPPDIFKAASLSLYLLGRSGAPPGSTGARSLEPKWLRNLEHANHANHAEHANQQNLSSTLCETRQKLAFGKLKEQMQPTPHLLTALQEKDASVERAHLRQSQCRGAFFHVRGTQSLVVSTERKAMQRSAARFVVTFPIGYLTQSPSVTGESREKLRKLKRNWMRTATPSPIFAIVLIETCCVPASVAACRSGFIHFLPVPLI